MQPREDHLSIDPMPAVKTWASGNRYDLTDLTGSSSCTFTAGQTLYDIQDGMLYKNSVYGLLCFNRCGFTRTCYSCIQGPGPSLKAITFEGLRTTVV